MHLAHPSVPRSIREQRKSVTVLLAGTSGTGKSMLAVGHGTMFRRLATSPDPLMYLAASGSSGGL